MLFTGSAVTVSPWIQRPAAVLQAWYAGQAAGGAVADVLFGVVNPSGRLAETFPVRLEDTPAYLDFPGDGDIVRYGEGVFVGYRWYDARDLPVAFPFGHGLSYTTFDYRNAHASQTSFAASDGITVAVDVLNTGSRSGSEVVQLYATTSPPLCGGQTGSSRALPRSRSSRAKLARFTSSWTGAHLPIGIRSAGTGSWSLETSI